MSRPGSCNARKPAPGAAEIQSPLPNKALFRTKPSSKQSPLPVDREPANSKPPKRASLCCGKARVEGRRNRLRICRDGPLGCWRPGYGEPPPVLLGQPPQTPAHGLPGLCFATLPAGSNPGAPGAEPAPETGATEPEIAAARLRCRSPGCAPQSAPSAWLILHPHNPGVEFGVADDTLCHKMIPSATMGEGRGEGDVPVLESHPQPEPAP